MFHCIKNDNTFSIATLFLLQMMAQWNTTFHGTPQGAQHPHAAYNREVYEHPTETTTARLHNATTTTLHFHPHCPNFCRIFCQTSSVLTCRNHRGMYNNVHDAVCREKSMRMCKGNWCHGQDSHQVLPPEPIPSVDLYNIICHHYQNKCLIHIPVYLSTCRP
jgi:hypothetical protein